MNLIHPSRADRMCRLAQSALLPMLTAAWLADENHGAANREALRRITARYLPQAVGAVATLARGIDERAVGAEAAGAVAATAVSRPS